MTQLYSDTPLPANRIASERPTIWIGILEGSSYVSGSIEEALEVPRWSIGLTIRVILDAARIAVSMNYFNHYE